MEEHALITTVKLIKHTNDITLSHITRVYQSNHPTSRFSLIRPLRKYCIRNPHKINQPLNQLFVFSSSILLPALSDKLKAFFLVKPLS